MCDDSCTRMKCIIIYDLNVITNQWLATSSWSNQQNRIAFSKLGTSLDKIQQFPRNNCIRNNETTKITLASSVKIVVQNTLHLLSNLQCCFAKLINVLWNLFSKKILLTIAKHHDVSMTSCHHCQMNTLEIMKNAYL